jgi:hypothetical protein
MERAVMVGWVFKRARGGTYPVVGRCEHRKAACSDQERGKSRFSAESPPTFGFSKALIAILYLIPVMHSPLVAHLLIYCFQICFFSENY